MLRAAFAATLLVVLAPSTARAEPPRSDAPPSAPQEDAETHDGYRGELSVIALMAAGQLPAIGSGASFGAGFRWPRWSFALEARLLSTLTGANAANVQVDSNLTMTALDLCWHRAFISGCAVLGVSDGRQTGEVIKLQVNRGAWVASAGLRIGADWLFSEHIALRGIVELHSVIAGTGFWVNNLTGWMTPPLFGVAGVGFMFPVGTL